MLLFGAGALFQTALAAAVDSSWFADMLLGLPVGDSDWAVVGRVVTLEWSCVYVCVHEKHRYEHTYYLLTPWSRVPLEKLTSKLCR